MKIDYAWTTVPLIEKIAFESQSYRMWFEGYWMDRVRDALEKNSEGLNEKAVDLQAYFRDISTLTDKFVSCNIDELEESAFTNFFNCKQLEDEIDSFKVESDAISEV